MKDYKIQITEILQRIVTVSANSPQDAIDEAKEQYRYEGIVLDADDMKGDAEFEVVK